MKKRAIHTIFGPVALVVMSLTLTLSTLHSHYHIEWNHPPNHVNTGHCLVVDSTLCPISGYLFGADVAPHLDMEQLLNGYYLPEATLSAFYDDYSPTPVSGRSPPPVAA